MQFCLQFMSPYFITFCAPAKLSAVHVTILHYILCASNCVWSSCHHTALHYVCQQGCLQFISPYCITVCVPARLSAVHVYILYYSVCASKAVCISCQVTALQCVCHQGCVHFVSLYFIRVCVPASLSAVHVTILHYTVCASKFVCSSCHHTALQCVCQQGCLQFMSPYCITVCVPARLSSIHVNIMRYSVCASEAVCSSCHQTPLVCVHQQFCQNFVSLYWITVCVPARLSAVQVNSLHLSVYDSKDVYISCHYTALHWVCQQDCLQFMSPYCFTISVCQQGSLHFISPHCITVCVPIMLSAVHVTLLHYSVCASKAGCISCHHTALQCVCQQRCLHFMSL